MKSNKYLVFVFLCFLTTALQSQCFNSISAGGYHTIAIKPNGTIYTWGNRSFGWGSLGLGSGSSNVSTPTLVNNTTNCKFITSGEYNTFIIKNDGTLWAAGGGEYGELGDGGFGNGHVFQNFTQIGTATNWKIVAANYGHTVALKTDGSLWAWGLNDSGQVGDGSYINRHLPVQIGTDTDWKTITAGDNYCLAIKNNGTMWSWGANAGNLGIDTSSVQNSPSPVQVSSWQFGTDSDWKMVTTGPGAVHTLVIKNNGKLYSFGTKWDNGTAHIGGLGLGPNAVIVFYPWQIGTDTNWQSVSVGFNNSFGIKTDGTLWAWGQNDLGQLGDGTTIDRGYPVQIGTDTDWASVSGGGYGGHTVALKTGGSLWAWGNSTYGQLGNGGTVSSLVPVQIPVSGCALGTEQFQDPIEKLVLSPNPASDFVNLNFNNITGDASIELYDVMGRVVKTYSVAEVSGAINVDVSTFASGIYMVVLKENGIVSLQRKLVKN